MTSLPLSLTHSLSLSLSLSHTLSLPTSLQFVAVLNLDDVAGVSSSLQAKLRQRVSELSERKISVLKMFLEADQVIIIATSSLSMSITFIV